MYMYNSHLQISNLLNRIHNDYFDLYALNLYFYVFCHCANCQLCIITRSHLVVWLICQCQPIMHSKWCSHISSWRVHPCMTVFFPLSRSHHSPTHAHSCSHINLPNLFVRQRQTVPGGLGSLRRKEKTSLEELGTWTKIFDSTCGQRNLSGSSCMSC